MKDHTHVGWAIHDDAPVLADHMEMWHGGTRGDHRQNLADHEAAHADDPEPWRLFGSVK